MLKKIKINYVMLAGFFVILSLIQVGATIWNDNTYAEENSQFDFISSTDIQDSNLENTYYQQLASHFYRLDDGSYAIMPEMGGEFIYYYNKDGSLKSTVSIYGHVGYAQQVYVQKNGNITLFGDNKLV